MARMELKANWESMVTLDIHWVIFCGYVKRKKMFWSW
jgi:hypothetical protein